MSLGAAFQKVNFLRDFEADTQGLDRVYFPNLDFNALTDQAKKEIETDIENDFSKALISIKKLPKEARFGVYTAYIYYFMLFEKIKGLRSHQLRAARVRIPNYRKMLLLVQSKTQTTFDLL